MARRTAEKTRALLLNTGIAMLHEQGVIAGVAHVRLQDVVTRADLSTGAAYRLWPDQAAFHEELAAEAIRWRAEDPITTTVRAIREVVDSGGSLREVVRAGTEAHIRDAEADVDHAGTDGRAPTSTSVFLTTLALRAGVAHSEPLRAASSQRHAESIRSYRELYTALMGAYGLEMQPPSTIDHFTLAVAALGEGFALQAIEGERHPRVMLVDPDDGEEREWTLFGVVTLALQETHMSPISVAETGPSEAQRR